MHTFPSAFSFASERVRGDKGLVLNAVLADGMNLEWLAGAMADAIADAKR